MSVTNPAYLFSAQTITSFEDATLNFEQLAELFSGSSGQQAAVLQLQSLQNLTIVNGGASVSFSGASATSSTATVTHNLRVIPTVTLAGVTTSEGFFVIANVVLGASTTTQFQVRGFTPQGTPAAQTTVIGWMAIG